MASLTFPAPDPVLLDLPGPLDLRYYGLMYIVGFVAAQFILTRLARRGFLPLPEAAVGDFLGYGILGVILGGRFGYALFYEQGLLHPLRIIRVWEGGLSFHGGLLGVCVAFALFARKHKVPLLRMGDACALAVTPGILAVRVANFINGELYGRTTTAGTFGAMQFPTDPRALAALGLDRLPDKRQVELGIQCAYGRVPWEDIQDRFPATDPAGNAIPWEQLLDWERVSQMAVVPFRHPSQLYEGLGEGLLLGLVLWIVYRLTRSRPLGGGAYGGIFLVGYGVVRFFIEYLRQPDAQFTGPDDPVGVVFLGMTMGQTLCSVMMLIGATLVWRGRRRVALPPPVPAAD